eukprot:TRINITY_DN10318_c0_g1_i4.p1 TRINITY_DN10318_c0_g1~~TRINITY_DN10318_c0_g1_i4.p1  ORF type:complete len:121 (-),score=22.19 TRINITY_DN10318_c0_g1_i4:72-434(-)
MKICLLLSVLGFSACYASPQFNFFNGFFRGGRRPQRPQQLRQGPSGGGGGRCGGGNQPNYKNYLVSWRLGCTSFSQSAGESFCRANGMRPISLDSSDKEKEFLDLVASDRQKYFWTGRKG